MYDGIDLRPGQYSLRRRAAQGAHAELGAAAAVDASRGTKGVGRYGEDGWLGGVSDRALVGEYGSDEIQFWSGKGTLAVGFET